jgi:glutamine amidotransferase-like uncharacterized protein
MRRTTSLYSILQSFVFCYEWSTLGRSAKLTKKRSVFGISLLLLFCILFFLPVHSQAQTKSDDLTGIRVAVYNGYGVMLSSHTALTKMFEWMNATVARVNASQILDGVLGGYDILVIPGGSESTCNSELSTEGKQRVKDFVTSGGSYFGICGGATFGALYLSLFDGYMTPVNEPDSLIHMTTMHINQSSTGPDLSDCPESVSTLYYASQYFRPNSGTSVQVIATYDYNERAGMIAFHYGSGTVFLSSPHPEYEEDSDRDDTTFADYLNDPESEWDLLLRVSRWLVEASPASSDLFLIVIGSTAGIVAILLAVVIYRRRYA